MASNLLKSRRRGRAPLVQPVSSKKACKESRIGRVLDESAAGWERQRFLRLFQGGFATTVSVPYDQGVDFYGEAGQVFTIIAPSGYPHKVRLERVGDEMLFTEGWPGVVLLESISELDVAMFARCGDTGLRMFVYRRTGEEKGVHRCTSFLRLFRYGFSQSVDVNDGCGQLFEGKTGNAVTIIGPSGKQHVVLVERFGRDVFLGSGWDTVALVEGIEQMDVGHFYSDIDGRFELTVFSRSGVQKPPYTGPVPVSIDDTFFPWKQVGYAVQPNTELTPYVKHRMHCLWINSAKTIDLYVARLTRAQARGPWMHFTNSFSFKLPADGKLLMRFSGRAVEAEGAFVKVHGSARIVSGWPEFVQSHMISAGSVYIFKFFMHAGILRLTVYNA